MKDLDWIDDYEKEINQLNSPSLPWDNELNEMLERRVEIGRLNDKIILYKHKLLKNNISTIDFSLIDEVLENNSIFEKKKFIKERGL